MNAGVKGMKKISLVAMMMLAPIVANAAGTYYSGYTGAYQSPQTSYASGYANRYNSYSTPSYASTRYNTYNNYNTNAARNVAAQRPTTNQNAATQTGGGAKKSGFWLDAGITHEMAQWQFSMNQSGSILSYDNLAWNVLGVDAGYAFDMGNTTVQIDAGLKYGMQWGESVMYDDDITNGGYLVTSWIDGSSKEEIGDQIGHALSMGTSKGGNMLGFNVGIGLTDVFKIGSVTLTPSVGYRYLKYNLTTENNYGLAVDTAGCVQVDGSDEVQCDPAIVIVKNDGETSYIIWRGELVDGKIPPLTLPDGTSAGDVVDTGGTYYYKQPGVSHSYETTWAGPYIALDMDYVINQNNAVNGRIELGFPGYTSVGDQPYRFDWQHPKSVEDTAGMFSAIHFGAGFNWTTAITDSVALSLGMTYDYYSVSGADAKTYLNVGYYENWYNDILAGYDSEDDMLDPDTGDPTAINIKDLLAQCPNGVCTTNGEIESFYKSLGIRVGINAKF